MFEALKKLNKKFLIIAFIIILSPILLILFLAMLRGCSNNITYEKYEDKMISAASEYFKDNDKLPKEEAQIESVDLSTLVSGEYIKSSEKLLNDSTCNGSVSVRMNGVSASDSSKGQLNYTVNLECSDYKTTTIKSKLLESVTTSESGLYKVDNEYIFKGDNPNNYVSFNDKTYLILSMDLNGIIKLVNTDTEGYSRMWDNKYNVESSKRNGINIYKDSLVLEYMMSDYLNPKKYSDSVKKHIVAYDVCIGKRNSGDYSISSELDCSSKLEKQLVSLMNVSDFARASLDSNCNSIISASCNNYNYLYNVIYSTWTLNTVLDNTYEAFYISDGIAGVQELNEYDDYNVVIYIDANEIYTSGNGTITDPYVIK